MEYGEYQTMRAYSEYYWWHIGKRHLLKSLYEKFVKNKGNLAILEIGCGSGDVLSLVQDWGNVRGIDISPEAVNYCKIKGFKNVVCGDLATMDISNEKEKYDIILALDVLEHIQDDVDIMKKVNKMLKREGLFFITVPAFKFLWSTHDEALHHKRRYHSVELRRKLIDSGFNILLLTHFVALLFFPISIIRLMSNFIRRSAYPKASYVDFPKIINLIFAEILKIESLIIRNFYQPFGTTIVSVAKKK